MYVSLLMVWKNIWIKPQVPYVAKSLDGLTWSVNSFINEPSQPNNSSRKITTVYPTYKILSVSSLPLLSCVLFFPPSFHPQGFKAFYNGCDYKIIIRKIKYLMKKIIKDNLFFYYVSIFMFECFKFLFIFIYIIF